MYRHIHTYSHISVARPHKLSREHLVVFARTISKIITDFVPEEVAVDCWLVYLANLFGGMVPFRGATRVFLNAAYGLEWSDFCSEVGFEEKGDAGLCQVQVRKPKKKRSTHDTLERDI